MAPDRTASDPPQARPAESSARRLGGYLAVGGLMVVLDTTVTVVAVPELIGEFDARLSTAQWVTTAYALALLTIMPLAAWTVGRLGARRVYLLALGVFTLGSLLTGVAWGIPALIASRVVQGLGGGLLAPVGMSIALAAVDPEARGRMMSLQGLPVLLGPLLGPVLGGTLIDHASWRWIFWINVPIGVAAMVLGIRVLPRTRQRDSARLDVVGLLLLCPGVTLVVLALSLVGERGGLPPLVVLAPLGCGLAMVAVFGYRAWHTTRPLLQVRILRRPSMSAGAVTLALFGAAYFGSAVIVPTYVQIVRGDPATVSGAVGIPQALATGVALQVATRLVERVQPRLVVGAGIGTALTGVVLVISVLDAHTPYPFLMVIGALTGLGVGATLMPLMTAATRSLTGDDLPSGTALLAIISQTAVALGTALVATVLSWLVTLHAPGLGSGGITTAARLGPVARAGVAADLTEAVRLTFGVTAVLMALAWLSSLRLPLERTGRL